MVNDQAAARVIAGRYELGRLLGTGGMAAVHHGRDPRLEREVAIKLLRPDFVADATALHRFRREARSAARLSHPKIIAVYDSGEDQGVSADGRPNPIPFIVMEYVPGKTVRDILHANCGDPTDCHTPAAADVPTGDALSPDEEDQLPTVDPMTLSEAVAITTGVLDALAYSHECGIIHRDIKPGNVLLTETGDVKVMDFGIARALSDQATQTSSEAVVGTAQYLSPEQAQGADVDQRTDLYSTGCLLYELLTGRTPFVGDTPVSIAYQHVRETPKAPSSYNSEISAQVDRVVLKALAKERTSRYSTAEEFRQDLLAAVQGSAVSAPDSSAYEPAPDQPTIRQVPLGKSAQPPEPDNQSPYYTSAPIMPTPSSAQNLTGTGDVVALGPPPEPNLTGRIVGYIALSIAVLIVLSGAFAVIWTNLSSNSRPVAVQEELVAPNLVNMTAADARTKVEELNLRYAEGEARFSAVEAGTVLDASPADGIRVHAGQTITVILSKGPEEIVVPEVTRFERVAAKKFLEEARLIVDDVVIVDDPAAPKNTVTEVVPKPGTKVSPGTKVTLKVSSGNVSLPNLTGKSLTEAQKALNDLGLEPRISYQESTKQPPEHVLTHRPGPSRVQQWSKVELVIAQKPKPTIAPTPTATPAPTATPTPTKTATQQDPG